MFRHQWQREKKQIAQELEEKLKKSMERLGDDAQQECEEEEGGGGEEEGAWWVAGLIIMCTYCSDQEED